MQSNLFWWFIDLLHYTNYEVYHLFNLNNFLRDLNLKYKMYKHSEIKLAVVFVRLLSDLTRRMEVKVGHTMNVCSSVGQRLKSLINEPKRRRNYVREKDIFHSHYERFISGQFNFNERF